ncbi:MAG: DUF262 domain-containing protein [Prevotella shahii]|jgi:hypothetical protein|uniref:DUF262 domain-containing protein n=1 Tax=Hoylesella shahii TaxID=228603 RepID=UPI001CAE5879|nr:DUF262 domain-containing HNH endonuclease family protein [Hoylesella shahii]MBF1568868.1 DUF262 domain-containing protein [Hoylesella shahii]
MNTNRYTPAIITAENYTFSIPLYQRLFAWGEEQVNGLLHDLKNHFEKEGEVPYYLGMLSCIENEERYDLIDGQQRFTLMMLLGITFQKEGNGWDKFLAGGKRLTFKARSKDTEYIKSLIHKSSFVAEKNEKMNCGIQAIRNFMDKEFEDETTRETFAQRVYNHLSFFFSELPKEYAQHPESLNKYFEAMNNSGKGLEQHEILKVDLMRGEENQVHLTRIWNLVSEMNRPVIKYTENTTEDEYRGKYITAIQACRNGQYGNALSLCEDLTDNDSDKTLESIVAERHEFARIVGHSERSILSFPDFLRLNFAIFNKVEASYNFYREELLRIFKTDSIANKQNFYHQLLFTRLLIDYYFIYKEGNETVTRYNLLFNTGEQKEALTQYQSMLYVSTTFYSWMRPILQELMNSPIEKTDKLLDLLKVTDNGLHPMPTNTEDLSYGKVDRYYFWRLDYYLWENRDAYFEHEEDRMIVKGYLFKANRSIEHVHPQNQDHNSEWGEDAVNSFGNLALISQSFNSQQSNDSVNVKFARIEDQADNAKLESIKMYRIYLDAKRTPDGWDEKAREKHEEEMYNLLKKSYSMEE